jgi:hypothetical protein
MQDLANALHGCAVFSKIDLVKGYHQFLMAAEVIQKTAIITPFSQFEYLFTPFGLSNDAQTLQHMMDHTVGNLEAVFAYMDDSRVGSTHRQTQLTHLEALSAALAASGLAINLEKYIFTITMSEI